MPLSWFCGLVAVGVLGPVILLLLVILWPHEVIENQMDEEDEDE